MENEHSAERDLLLKAQKLETLGVKQAREKAKPGSALGFLMRITGFGRIVQARRKRQDAQRALEHRFQREKLERRHKREAVEFRTANTRCPASRRASGARSKHKSAASLSNAHRAGTRPAAVTADQGAKAARRRAASAKNSRALRRAPVSRRSATEGSRCFMPSIAAHKTEHGPA